MKHTTLLLIFSMLIPIIGADQRPFRIVFAQDYPPFCWEENSSTKGVLVDFVEILIGESLGVDIEYEVCPWARCQLMVQEGKRDAFFTIPTPKRELFTSITKLPVFSSNFVLWTGSNNRNRSIIEKLTSLELLRNNDNLVNIQIIGGGWHTKNLQGAKRMMSVVNSSDILDLLAKNVADIYIEQELLVRYQMKKHGYTGKIIMISNIMDKTNWHIMIGKDSGYSYLIPKLDELLKRMQASGEQEKLRIKLFQKYQ